MSSYLKIHLITTVIVGKSINLSCLKKSSLINLILLKSSLKFISHFSLLIFLIVSLIEPNTIFHFFNVGSE